MATAIWSSPGWSIGDPQNEGRASLAAGVEGKGCEARLETGSLPWSGPDPGSGGRPIIDVGRRRPPNSRFYCMLISTNMAKAIGLGALHETPRIFSDLEISDEQRSRVMQSITS